MTLDEVRRLRAKLHGSQWDNTTLAERDAVYEMAERYAYLRAAVRSYGVDIGGRTLYGDELDAAIDAAMKGGET